MLGFSLYFENNKKIEDQLEGYEDYDILFTSLHYPAGGDIFENFSNLYNTCKDLNLDICVDINNETLIEYPMLLDMDLILRLDFGFTPDEIRSLSNTTRLAVNGSTVDYKFLKDLSDHEVVVENIIGWHNYYPLDFSGLGRDYFENQNELLESFKMKTAAFVPGNEKLRGPVYKGLPSLEDHRYKNPHVCLVELERAYGIDICLIGETVNKIDESYIKKFFNENLISLPVYLNKEYEDLKEMEVRADISDFIIRNNREKRKVNEIPSQYIHRGDILICNDLSGRYAGEIEIARKDLGILKDRNVIGRIHRDYVKILDFIKGGDRLVFDRK